MKTQLSILVAFIIFGCSVLDKDKENAITTTYGFNASDVVAEFGEIDSMTVWVIDGGDTVDVLHFKGDDLDEKNIVRFPIDAASEAQVRVDYRIYAGGEAVAGGGQTFVSGETPTIPRPQRKPLVGAGADTTICVGKSLSLKGEVLKREENIVVYEWDFDGDGTSDRSDERNRSFEYIYDSVGIFSAVFLATDNLGLVGKDTLLVSVCNIAPVISSIDAGTVSVNDTITLSLNASDADENMLDSVWWDLDADGSFETIATASTSTFFADTGNYTVRAFVKDVWGLTDTASVVISVIEDLPVALAGDDIFSLPNASIDLSATGSSDVMGSIVKYEWNINNIGFVEVDSPGDTTITVPTSPVKDYPCILKVTDDDGGVALDTVLIHVGYLFDDRDNSYYQIVKIGTQTWMAENLNYDTANGTGSWCYDNLSTNCDTYGRLYDWNTVMAGAASDSANPSGVRGICPEGWHVPSDGEWTQLSDYLGGEAVAGTKLKSVSWDGTDEVGFAALPSGYPYIDGSFNGLGTNAGFWSATEIYVGNAWARGLGGDDARVGRFNIVKGYGFSLRCVQDF